MCSELSELESIIRSKKVVIYGAGIWASIFYSYMNAIKMDDNVVCFTVTQIEDFNTKLYDKEIKQFDEIEENISDCFVVIAVKNAGELMNILSKSSINGYYHLTKSQIQEMKELICDSYSNLPIQRNKIFVYCFGGKSGYGCNCKYIVEKLLSEEYSVEIVWCVENNSSWQFPKGIRTVVYNSLEYFRDLYTAGIIIDNCGVTCYPYKRKEQYMMNTWHGSGPFKKVGVSLYVDDEDIYEQYIKMFSYVDVFLSNSADNTEMFRDSFLYCGEIYESGSPRNDILFTQNNIKEQIYKKFGIESGKKILLYAPTFRGGWAEAGADSSFDWYDLDMQYVLETLSQRFGGEFILMYRFHNVLYEYGKPNTFYPFGIDVTYYPDVMELLVAADILITDYSSVMWDFSLQRRPVFLYHNDECEYSDDRGFYWPIARWPYPRAHTCEELCQVIRRFSEEEYLQKLEVFFEEDPSYDDGHASERAVERIMDVINHPEKYGKE